jgi:DNA-binding NarL/FixJ family response regulator
MLDTYVAGAQRSAKESTAEKLSAREREILQLLAEGRGNKSISLRGPLKRRRESLLRPGRVVLC